MRSLVVVCAVAALTACREGVAPYELPKVDSGDEPSTQLTYGPGQDLDPRWTPEGDSILYHTTATDALPGVPGALMRISASGGRAEPVFADVQQSRMNLTTPVPSPSGDRIAYFDIVRRDTPAQCSAPPTNQWDPFQPVCRLQQPLLDSVVLRVRAVGATRLFDQDPSLGVRVQGTSFDQLEAPFFQVVFPFHVQNRDEHAFLFRPSWSPDGQRLAFSDGLRILVWQVGAAMATEVPGTDNGVSPAWSPDGSRIAFTALVRGDSVDVPCGCVAGPRAFGATRRTYAISARRLVVTRTDGSDRVELGEGEDPAWSPDGTAIYARRLTSISRVAFPSGSATLIPGTEFARAPAISPDGTRLAFVRSKVLPPAPPPQNNSVYDWDIWVARLSQ